MAQLCMERTKREGLVGDGDPLDICVLMETNVSHGDILLRTTPIGGLRMLDRYEADDKIIGVLKGDALYGDIKDIADCPNHVINRLTHYFLTYKDTPGTTDREVLPNLRTKKQHA